MKRFLLILFLCSLADAQYYPPATGGGGGSGTVTSVTVAGTSNQITATGSCSGTTVISCTLSIPSGLVLPGTIDGLTITTTTGTFTLANAKTLTVNNSMTLASADGATPTLVSGTMVPSTMTNIAAPSSPSAGQNSIYSDSTDLRFHDKNASGAIGTTAVAITCTNQVMTVMSTGGVFTCATITSAFTSGTFTATAHNLLSATHGDTTASSAVRGGGIFATGASPLWTQVAHSSATGGYFKWNGTDMVASTGAAAGTGSCTNQFVSAENADASPTCAAVASAQLSITTTTCTAPQMVTAISSGAVGTCTAPIVTQNSQSAAYTTVLGDAGKQIYHPSADTTARTWTIDSNANVAYAIGTTLTFINDTSAGVVTIAITSDTLVLAGSGATGSRTLAASGIATAVKVTATRWIINGTGIS